MHPAQRWHFRFKVLEDAGSLSQSRIAEKEEGAVFSDRPTDAAAELIPAERILPQGRLPGQPAIGVQMIIAKEFEEAAMNAVGPRLGNNVHDSSREPSILRGEAVGDHPELLHCIRVRRHASGVPQSAHVSSTIEVVVDGSDSGVGRPVQQRHPHGRTEIVGRIFVELDAGRERQEAVEIAVYQRQVFNILIVDGQA